jgi:MFS family permease
MDRLGTRKVVPVGAVTVGIGALLFSTGDQTMGSIGRFLQGAGGVFALIGAVYIASKYFPASRAATLIGATQMFGMAGGSAGQFAVGPLINGGVSPQSFWIWMGVAGITIGAILWFLLPKEEAPQ